MKSKTSGKEHRASYKKKIVSKSLGLEPLKM